MRFTRNVIAVAATVVAVAATASSCASRGADASVDGRGISAVDVVSEYHVEAGRLLLPPAWRWPSDLAYSSTGPDGRPLYYQSGYGTTQADYFWYCAWESTYVTSPQGTSVRTLARDQLLRVRKTHMYEVDVLLVDRPFFNTVLNKALADNVELMKKDVELNCPKSP